MRVSFLCQQGLLILDLAQAYVMSSVITVQAVILPNNISIYHYFFCHSASSHFLEKSIQMHAIA